MTKPLKTSQKASQRALFLRERLCFNPKKGKKPSKTPPAVDYRGIFRQKKYAVKETDPETGLYYYGARYLDPKTSRWISGDPALGEYLPSAPLGEEEKKRNRSLPGQGGVFNYVNLHVYHYAGNNPVKYVDPDGRIAGEEFDTMDAAAIDFANTYNDDSIRHKREYGSSIYKNDNGKYVYTTPNVGSRTNVKCSTDSSYKDKRVGTIHTHTDGMDMDYFTPDDIDLAHAEEIPSYLVTADGIVSKYDPAKDDGSYGGWKLIEEPIYYDAPNLHTYNNYPDNKIKVRDIIDLWISFFPYVPK